MRRTEIQVSLHRGPESLELIHLAHFFYTQVHRCYCLFARRSSGMMETRIPRYATKSLCFRSKKKSTAFIYYSIKFKFASEPFYHRNISRTLNPKYIFFFAILKQNVCVGLRGAYAIPGTVGYRLAHKKVIARKPE